MLKKKIIFMGTPEISAIYLNYLIQENFNIISVVTQPAKKKGRGLIKQESAVHKISKINKINVFTPLNLNDKEFKSKVHNLNPDLIIVMGYSLKLPDFILNIPKFGCINVHVSLLPRWRGTAPIKYSLLNGDKKTGITIFKVVEKMDAGPILINQSIEIEENINKDELTDKLNLIGTKLLNQVLPNIFNNKVVYKNQVEDQITYAPKISTDLRKINFYEDMEVIHNKIRAFSFRPGAWFNYEKEIIKIIKSQKIKGDFEPSLILNDRFHIGCNDGKICPEIIQRAGKKPMFLEEFLRGFKFKIGSQLNVKI